MVTDNKRDTDTGATKSLKKPPKKDSGQSVDGVDDGGRNSSGKNTDQEISDNCWTVQGIVDNIQRVNALSEG